MIRIRHLLLLLAIVFSIAGGSLTTLAVQNPEAQARIITLAAVAVILSLLSLGFGVKACVENARNVLSGVHP